MRLMRNFAGIACAALASLCWANAASAVGMGANPIPYVGAGYLYEIPDSSRDSDNGQGGQLQLGLPLGRYGYPNWSAEATLHRVVRDRDLDGKSDYQTGLLFDLVYDFGSQSLGGGYGVKPFLLGGLGAVQNDVRGDKHEHFAFDLGGGLLLPLGWKGLAARVEGRALGQIDSKSTDRDVLFDYRFTAGLQLPLFFLYRQHEPAVPPAQDCELAVVDPDTDRSDCAVDSDRDGVADGRDRCPGTASGGPVDADGCLVVAATAPAGDEDADGMPDELDRCLGTGRGLSIEATGCVFNQSLALRGTQFEIRSAVLTAPARKILDGVVATLKGQPGLAVRITGDLGAEGSQSVGQQLTQQRAESVRQYLLSRGADPARLHVADREVPAAGADVVLTLAIE